MSALIDRKRSVETEVSYDIPHRYRIAAFDAWNHARKIGMDLNTLIEFEFRKNLEDTSIDIARVRKVSQYVRVCIRNTGVIPLILWTRHSNTEGTVEKVGLITNSPEGKFDSVKSIIENWDFEKFKVFRVDNAQKSLFVNSQPATVLEYLFRAVCSGTRVRLPDAPSELSGPIVGPRTFVALRLRTYNRGG